MVVPCHDLDIQWQREEIKSTVAVTKLATPLH